MVNRTFLQKRVLLAITIAFVAVACGRERKPGDESDSTSVSVTPSGRSAASSTSTGTTAAEATATERVTVRVYFTRGEEIGVAARRIPTTRAVASAAVRELLTGPTATEASYGLGSTVPDGTELRDLTVNAGIATVDLSDAYDSGGGTLSMRMRLAQVVYTLTQFPTVERVVFKIEGALVEALGGEGILIDTPQTRGDYEDLTPAILVESPAPGESVASPLRIRGTANTFEASFMARILASDGAVLVEQPMMATSGTGTRGTFDAKISFRASKPDMGSLVVFESSAKDGSSINVVTIPVMLNP